MIGQVGKGRALTMDAIADGGVGVDDHLGADGQLHDLDLMAGQLVEMQVCSEFAHIDWKQRRRQILL